MILPAAALAGLTAGRDNESEAMRERSIELQDYYQGRQRAHLDDIYAKIFADWSAVKGEVPLRTANITAKMVRTLAQAYRQPPARTIVNADGDEIDSPAYNRHTDATHKSIVLKEAERMSILHKACLVVAEWDEARRSIRYRILLPYQADVLSSAHDAQNMEAVVFTVKRPESYLGMPTGGLAESYIYMDAEHAYEFSAFGDIRRPDGQEASAADAMLFPEIGDELRNPYGVLPVVAFRSSYEVSDQFWPYIDDTWVSLNQAVNQVLTDLFMAENFQAFAQWWTRGGGSGYNTATGQSTAANLRLSRMSILELGPEGELGSTSPDSHISEIIDVLEIVMRLGAWTSDVGEFSLNGAKQIQSGIAYIMSRYDTIENTENRREFYRQAEGELFRVEKAILNYQVGAGIPDDARLDIVFDKGDSLKSTAERIELEKFELENNITTAAELLRRRRPDVKDIEQARERVAENRAENTANMSRFTQTPTVSAANLNSLAGQEAEDAE